MNDRSSKIALQEAGDPLTAMLRGLRLDGVAYRRCRMAAEWSFHYPARSEAYFHLVGGQVCWLRAPDGEWSELFVGDAVLLPRGAEHVLASQPDIAPTPSPEGCCNAICESVSDYEDGAVGNDERHVLFGGTMRFNIDASHPIVATMPEILYARRLVVAEPTIPLLLDAMVAECSMSRVGASGILARLADVMAAQIIRSWVEHGCADTSGWMAAMRDPRLGKVIAAIHADPQRDWTVAELAREISVSRSSFATMFTQVVGATPARYVAEVRMNSARQWILRDRIRISEAARRLNYDSGASFSRAFKRIVGIAPGRLRAREGTDAAR